MTGNYYNAKGVLDPNGAYARVSSILDIRKEPQIEAYKHSIVATRGLEGLLEDKAFYTSRGTLIHEAAETFVKTGDEVHLPETMLHFEDEKPCRALFEGFKKWHNKVQPEGCLTEVSLRSNKHMYAGTCDLPCFIDGETWIVDYKTAKAFRPSMGLQLRAYQQAYFEMQGILPRTAILQLAPELKRGYRWKEYNKTPEERKEALEVFLAHKRVFDWMRPEALRPEASTWDGKSIMVAA